MSQGAHKVVVVLSFADRYLTAIGHPLVSARLAHH